MVCAPVRRDNPRALALYLTCTTITSVDLAHYGVSRAKNWVSVDRGTKLDNNRAMSYCACSRCGRGDCLDIFLTPIISLLFLILFGKLFDIC